MDHTTARNLSYDVRRAIAQRLGKPDGSDFTANVDVTFVDGGTATLVTTSNAGFRGIEGWFELPDGSRQHRSLGFVASVIVGNCEFEVAR